MNDYYAAHWPQLRTVEGASQRVQEDAMRFPTSMEGLGVNLIDAIMTLPCLSTGPGQAFEQRD